MNKLLTNTIFTDLFKYPDYRCSELKVCDWIDAVPWHQRALNSVCLAPLGLPSPGPKQKLEIQLRIAENKVGGSVTFWPGTKTRRESAG